MRVETPGGRLRLIRDLFDVSQAELAHRLGVSGAKISRWESDEIDMKSEDMRDVAQALGVTRTVLVADEEWEPLAQALLAVQRMLEESRNKAQRVAHNSRPGASYPAAARLTETDDHMLPVVIRRSLVSAPS